MSPEDKLARLNVHRLPNADSPKDALSNAEDRGAPPIGGENWPKPRFRSLRDFRAEYQRSLKWSAAESSIQAVSTRSRHGPATVRHHGS